VKPVRYYAVISDWVPGRELGESFRWVCTLCAVDFATAEVRARALYDATIRFQTNAVWPAVLDAVEIRLDPEYNCDGATEHIAIEISKEAA
jgi:hypothetical protein